MQSAINAGVFSPGSVTTPFTCDTGNCTFPEYKSFAYCSTCTDISSEISTTNYTRISALSNDSISSDEGDYLNFTLPSGLWGSQKNNHQFAMNLSSNGDMSSTFQAILGDSDGPGIRDHTYTNYPYGPGLEWVCRGYGAAQCSLEICIKIFSASIENGKLVETELYSEPGSWSNISLNPTVSTVDMSCVNETDKQTLEEEGYMWNDTTRWLAYSYNVSQGYTINASCMYQINLILHPRMRGCGGPFSPPNLCSIRTGRHVTY